MTEKNVPAKDLLELWNKVQETDPNFTKAFSKSGGFRGTSISPTYNNKKATQMFGPCGIGWGVEVIGQSFQEGAVLFTEKLPVGREVIHIVQINFWYIYNGEKGNVPSFGQTVFVGQNKNGLFTDEEAPKKSLTDAVTKALSMLGFSADIFFGMFDDVRYINDKKEQYSEKTIEGGVLDSEARDEAKLAFLKQVNDKMDNFKSLEELESGFTEEEKSYWKHKLSKKDPVACGLLNARHAEVKRKLSEIALNELGWND